MLNQLARLRGTVKYQFWAGLGHEGQTLDDLITAVIRAGNVVLKVDVPGQRVLVAVWDETMDRWGCLLCLKDETITILDSEQELGNHLRIAHPEWSVDDRS